MGGSTAVKRSFAHDAVLEMGDDADDHAPGGAVTVALCGSTPHPPPCPLAPHHTRAVRDGGTVRLRILFAADPADEPRVREMLHSALAAGSGTDAGGARTRWRLVSDGASAVRPEEEDHADRLTRS